MIDMHSSKHSPNVHGDILELWMDSVDDLPYLPKPGEWAALTSTALDLSTMDVYVLRSTGWRKL